MTDNFSDNMLKYENYKEQNNNNKKERLKDLMAEQKVRRSGVVGPVKRS